MNGQREVEGKASLRIRVASSYQKDRKPWIQNQAMAIAKREEVIRNSASL